MSRYAPSSLFSLLTTPGRGQRPWVQEPGAMRVLMHPSLGWPLGPLAVLATPISTDDMVSDIEWSIFGEADSPSQVVGEAWLVLRARDDQPDPGLVDLELVDLDEPPQVAVVRHIGDRGLGLAGRSSPPYRLIAPGINVIRIRGRCTVKLVRASRLSDHLQFAGARLLGAPVGQIPNRYHGIDPLEEAAWRRVVEGAPEAFPPEEPARAPLDRDEQMQRERDRVGALVEPWLRDATLGQLQTAFDDRGAPTALPTVRGHPKPSRAEIQDHATTLIAAGDIGLARWLGLADQLPDEVKQTAIVTAAGVWGLPRSHPLARRTDTLSEPIVRSFLQEAGLEEVVALADTLDKTDQPLLWMWTQAWVDPKVAADPPPPPSVEVRQAPIWVRGATEANDIALLPVETYNVALLGQVRLVRTDPDPAPLHEPINGCPDRLRPQLAVEGSAVTDRVPPPFAARTFHGWQCDAFGRWSSDFNELRVAALARPSLPTPDPMVRPGSDAPKDDEPWRPQLDVRVPVPARIAGQREIATVSVKSSGDPDPVTLVARGDLVETKCAGPPLAPGSSGIAVVTVTFAAAGDTEVSEATTRSIAITDPRPPASPIPPPVLNFASHANANGVSTATVPFPTGSGIAGYLVDVAREGDLVMTKGRQPPANLDRDEQAQFWLKQSRERLRPAFYRLTLSTVPMAAGSYQHDLPGDLAELVVFRLVPVGENGASPPVSACGLTVYAVPRDVAPPQPVLVVDRSGASAALEVRCAPGSVAGADFRIRAIAMADADPRTGRVVATGVLTDGVGRVEAPTLRPFEVTTYVAEVRGEQEIGAQPSRGRWSAPSNALSYRYVPSGAPTFVNSARADGKAIVFEFDDAHPALIGDHGFFVSVYRLDAATQTHIQWRDPVILSQRVDIGESLPPEPLTVIVTDPLARRSAPITVERE